MIISLITQINFKYNTFDLKQAEWLFHKGSRLLRAPCMHQATGATIVPMFGMATCIFGVLWCQSASICIEDKALSRAKLIVTSYLPFIQYSQEYRIYKFA